jgi:hypothetical protein
MSPTNIQSIRVFLCHATNDKPSVRRLYKKLTDENIRVWFDEENLLPGQDWDAEIQNAVRQSDIVIICLSNKSVTKEGYVQKEIKIALDVADEKPEGTIFIVPIRLEECNVPSRIQRWQWIDLFSPVSEIDNNNFKKLIRSLELRAEQIKLKLHSTESTEHDFESHVQMYSPFRAWLSPNPKTILNNITYPEPNYEEINRLKGQVEYSLHSLKLPSQIIEINWGSRIIRYGVEPLFKYGNDERIRVSVSDILSVADDLILLLGIAGVQVEFVPKKRYIAIDIPHRYVYDISLLGIFESEKYPKIQKPLSVALGRDIEGNPIHVDLSSFPNILLCGAMNSGKSMCMTSIIFALLLNNNPDEIKLLFIDLRRVEFSAFFDFPHLLSPVVVNEKMAVSAFDWLLKEADERIRLFAKVGVRNVDEYNSQADFEEKLPFIVVFVSELSDLKLIFTNKLQSAVAKIAGLARLTGIHLIFMTQRPSPDVITEVIKANFSNRITLKVLSDVDSINIIGRSGGEKLLGRGDMLFLGAGRNVPVRLQGLTISDDEIIRLTEFWKSQIT